MEHVHAAQIAHCQAALERQPYIAAHSDAERRMQRGQRQVFCSVCERWQWLDRLCPIAQLRNEEGAMLITHRGRSWTATPTDDPDRPYHLRSGQIEVELVRLSWGRPHELTPMQGTRQLTARYGLFSDDGGELHPLDP
jgi:hypothetical protein